MSLISGCWADMETGSTLGGGWACPSKATLGVAVAAAPCLLPLSATSAGATAGVPLGLYVLSCMCRPVWILDIRKSMWGLAHQPAQGCWIVLACWAEDFVHRARSNSRVDRSACTMPDRSELQPDTITIRQKQAASHPKPVHVGMLMEMAEVAGILNLS